MWNRPPTSNGRNRGGLGRRRRFQLHGGRALAKALVLALALASAALSGLDGAGSSLERTGSRRGVEVRLGRPGAALMAPSGSSMPSCATHLLAILWIASMVVAFEVSTLSLHLSLSNAC